MLYLNIHIASPSNRKKRREKVECECYYFQMDTKGLDLVTFSLLRLLYLLWYCSQVCVRMCIYILFLKWSTSFFGNFDTEVRIFRSIFLSFLFRFLIPHLYSIFMWMILFEFDIYNFFNNKFIIKHIYIQGVRTIYFNIRSGDRENGGIFRLECSGVVMWVFS